MKIGEMITECSEDYIKIVDKAAWFERIDSDFERSPVRCSQTALHATGNSFVKGSQLMWQTSLLSYFKTLPQPPQTSATATLTSQ